MLNLFGDRFLILFAGNLQRRLKRPIPYVKDQNPEAITERSVEPTSDEVHEENLREGIHYQNVDEQNMKNDVG
jgi:hypothetical protein